MPETRKSADGARRPGEDPAHDVLAAEEFGVPARDPSLQPGPIALPSDPTGIAEPHDVLAAEEFAMPAPRYGAGRAGADPSRRGGVLTRAVGAVVALEVVRRVMRRGR
jgi:hypothetical protein